jgi:anaerobic magnesium-protoporphyrin IX monomethyl ester cyclase
MVYPRLRHQRTSFLPPLGVTLLATMARDAGHSVRMFDASFDEDLERIERELVSFAPQVVASSVSSDLLPAAQRISRFARSLGALSVMGGPHVTLLGAAAFEETPSLSVAVAGEAEHSFLALLERHGEGRSLEGVPGLLYRSGDRIVENAPAPWHEDLDLFPFPDRDLLPTYARYSDAGFTELILSRSCPFTCRYCQPTLRKVAGPYRKRGPVHVVDEIELLWKRYGNDSFLIDDDLFIFDKGWLAGIVQELEGRGLAGRLRFVALGRPDTFDEEMAGLLKRMGVYYILFGMESGSQAILDALDKRLTLAQIREAFRIAKAHGFKTHGFVILGSPAETPQTLRETEAFIEELAPASVFISLFTPTLGTYAYQELEAAGRTNLRKAEQMRYFSWADDELTFRGASVSYAQVVATRDRILRRRRVRFLANNALESLQGLLRERSLRRALSRAGTYRTQMKYHG